MNLHSYGIFKNCRKSLDTVIYMDNNIQSEKLIFWLQKTKYQYYRISLYNSPVLISKKEYLYHFEIVCLYPEKRHAICKLHKTTNK